MCADPATPEPPAWAIWAPDAPQNAESRKECLGCLAWQAQQLAPALEKAVLHLRKGLANQQQMRLNSKVMRAVQRLYKPVQEKYLAQDARPEDNTNDMQLQRCEAVARTVWGQACRTYMMSSAMGVGKVALSYTSRRPGRCG